MTSYEIKISSSERLASWKDLPFIATHTLVIAKDLVLWLAIRIDDYAGTPTHMRGHTRALPHAAWTHT